MRHSRTLDARTPLALAALLGLGAIAMALSPAAQAGAHGGAKPAATKDIVDTAAGAGSFNTLVAAVQAAGLVDALKGPGPLTVFAPTDAAFAALPAGTLDNLLKPENQETLRGILLYHVVSGKVMAADIKGTVRPATLQGATIEAVAASGGVTINGAKVTTADIAASNGVIHVIDAVILPPAN